MKKLLFRTVLCSLLLLAVFLPAFADEGGFYIKNYNSRLFVRNDASIDVQLDLDVNFYEYRHGIYFALPTTVSIEKENEAGRMITYWYQPEVSDIWVEGDPSVVDESSVRIGDADRTIIGDKHYTLGFHYVFGDDRVRTYDEFYYSLIGTDWDCEIENSSFIIEFEGSPDLSGMQFYCGKDGENGSEDVRWQADGNTVYGRTLRALGPREALTGWVRLPEGFFSEVRKKSKFMMYLSLLLSIAVFAFTVYRMNKINTERGKIVPTVEFHPPEDFNSAEVGYVIDEKADREDFVSLIVWFACHKNLKINEVKKNQIELEEITPPEGKAPYLKPVYEALFAKNRGEALYKAIEKAEKQVEEGFTGDRSLSDDRLKSRNIFWGLVSLGCVCLSLFCASYNCDYSDMAPLVWTEAGALLVWSMITSQLLQPANVIPVKKKLWFYRLFGLIVVIAFFWSISSVGADVFPFFAVSNILSALALLAVKRTSYASRYKIEITGKLQGFKNFIKTAELEKLKRLCDENPEYFYTVLPYAYVFGLSDRWIKQFEKLVVPPLENFSSYDATRSFNVATFVKSCDTSVKSYTSSVSSYSSSKSGSSGGSSGGGFGGGGGGSW
ncbi:MAG: DUF2207 domain-containing protein [Treponemataceae bacterium]|nr:DUF2207 domain-containing protein [Treponemataceae bacterium]